MRKFWVLTLLVLIGVVLPLAAQKRGVGLEGGAVDIVDARGEVVGNFTEAHALVIGECEYNNGWRRLPGAKEDAAAVKKLFEEQGFNVITLNDASSRSLRSGITNFLDKYAFNPNARIILYFAGHGATVDLGGRRMGYIVPVDAPSLSNNANFLQTAIPMTQFETWAKQYTSRHILFIFDSCFAGTVFRSQGSAPPAINRLTSQPVRQFITSGDADEEVPDESIFRRELEHALRNAAADTNKDGYVSGTELGLYLFDRVSNYMNGKQNPRIGKLNDTNLDKGDFIFAVSAGSTPPPPPPTTPLIKIDSPPTEVPQGKTEYFIGSWVANVEYNGSFDTYRITLLANGSCTIKIENGNTQQETNGNWSWDGSTFKLKATFRNAAISNQRSIDWTSRVSYSGSNSFNIIARAAANDSKSLIRFTFFRESSNASSITYKVGDKGPAGGIIFYDRGFIADGWRYLEAAPTDFTAHWVAYEKGVFDTDTLVGSGKQNTQIIVDRMKLLKENNRPAQICAIMDVNGYKDWFLPSKDELDLMYRNLNKKGLGGFSNNWYWSSSYEEEENQCAWFQDFSSGEQYSDYAENPGSVRAIRAF